MKNKQKSCVVFTLWLLPAGGLPSADDAKSSNDEREAGFHSWRLCDTFLESVEATEPGKVQFW